MPDTKPLPPAPLHNLIAALALVALACSPSSPERSGCGVETLDYLTAADAYERRLSPILTAPRKPDGEPLTPMEVLAADAATYQAETERLEAAAVEILGRNLDAAWKALEECVASPPSGLRSS